MIVSHHSSLVGFRRVWSSAAVAGERKRGASVLQQAEEHFRRSFRPKKIRPGFVVGTDGKAIKT